MIKPVANISFGEDENGEQLSHGQYWLTSVLTITAMVDYNLTDIDLDGIDQQVEEAKLKMKQDLRKGFCFITSAMNTAKINSIDYLRSVEAQSQAHIATVKTEFSIQWIEEV
jgi:hypothetical protein